MSERPDRPDEEDDELDRLASAHLDGLTTATEARRIASDPDLQERVAAMREVRAALRAEEPPGPGDRREQAIAAALDAFDEVAAGGGPTELAPRRARRGRATVQPWRILGIAAAVLLLVVAVPVVAELAGDDGDDTGELATGTADDTSARDDPAATAAPEGAGEAEESAGSAYSATAGDQADGSAAPVDLGAFATLDALHERVRAVAEAQPDVAAEEPSVERSAGDLAAVPCLDEAQAAPHAAGETVVLAKTATLDGRTVGVVVVAGADGARTMTVRDPARSCTVVAVRALGPG